MLCVCQELFMMWRLTCWGSGNEWSSSWKLWQACLHRLDNITESLISGTTCSVSTQHTVLLLLQWSEMTSKECRVCSSLPYCTCNVAVLLPVKIQSSSIRLSCSRQLALSRTPCALFCWKFTYCTPYILYFTTVYVSSFWMWKRQDTACQLAAATWCYSWRDALPADLWIRQPSRLETYETETFLDWDVLSACVLHCICSNVQCWLIWDSLVTMNLTNWIR